MRLITSTVLATGVLAAAIAPAQAERGSDGELRILYWQAASTLNPYLSGIAKEVEAASLVLEPLARFKPDGTLEAWLATEIPTLENGGISEDLRQITWTLKPDVLWSDGTPLTAEDVVFTWEYCTAPDGGCAAQSYFFGVSSVEALDDTTVQITFDTPNPLPYTAFVSSEVPILNAAQFASCMGAAAVSCTEANFRPIGTGPFVVTDFRPNDVASFEANPNFREADLPAFGTVTLKGGGDAVSSARAVLETGEFDYAWNLQVDPGVLAEMETAGQGSIYPSFGASVELLFLNQTAVNADLGDARSTIDAGPHPFLTDPAVGQAMSMAIDRATIADVLYGTAGVPTCNVIPAPPAYASTANDACLMQDFEGAKALLEEAGWTDADGDDVREKDGVRLSLLYQTSTNGVRQDTQALIKEAWAEIGIETELRSIAGSVFFSGDAGSPDTRQKFYADVEMYTDNTKGTDPQTYLANWRCDDMPAPGNQWQGGNMQRFCDPDYDATVSRMAETAAPEERIALAKEMNDRLVQSYTIIPLVFRATVMAWSEDLAGAKTNGWDSQLWNVQDWSRLEN